MTINLLTTSDDPRNITKSYTTIAEGVTCKPAEPCSILTPRIILNNGTNYIDTNYIYIPTWHRYYFAEVTALTGRELMLNCSVDVLMSYNLSDVPILATRSESAGVNYFPDKQLPVDPDRCFIEGILFPQQPFTEGAQPEGSIWENNNYLLIVNGN